MLRMTPAVLAGLIGSLVAQEGGSDGEPAASKTLEPNAMQFYGMARDEPAREPDEAPENDLRFAAGYPTWEVTFAEADFADPVANSPSARQLFAQAAAMDRCEMADPVGEREGGEGCRDAMQLAMLTAAHGALALESHPELTVSDAITLLRFSRHLLQIEHRDGHIHGRDYEALGMRLLAGALRVLSATELHSDAAKRAAAELEIHKELRRPITDYVDSELRVARNGSRSTLGSMS